ncbi:Vacuolar protein sorting-associated protein 13 second [Gracilaria domingensis]|nr:Vacuolar protein sorting-associated protein 13 second [Gracilaria domingensis]
MLEGIVSDGLVRLLGSYVDGLNRESIRLGVWRGDLELKNLRLRPDALAVLFETLGLDLPVTVTAGYIGLLRLEVPWKRLRSAPVRIFMHDVTVVASPVSDGDQSALELRDKRLKAARLATDEAIRDAKFSVRSVTLDQGKECNRAQHESSPDLASENSSSTQQTGNRITRWGWRFTSKFVTKIVDNIQIDVENVVVQYEDASSVRDRPYTATLAFNSLRACSTNSKWLPVFIESPDSPVVHKVVYMKGLVLNWEPGNAINDLKGWILNKEVDTEERNWLDFVQGASRHAIRPMDGELRIALTKSSALASALAGTDESLKDLKNVPRVQMDLHFPDVKIALDDFQYHTLLSTIMYLSDIDRKVRPKTARGRWFWALERLLPRFKERREAALRFTAEGMKSFRETREEYCRVRNAVVNARRNGTPEPVEDAARLQELEVVLPYKDVVMFRDIADSELYASLRKVQNQTPTTSRFWSFFSRRSQVVEPSSAASPDDPHLEANAVENAQASGGLDGNLAEDQEMDTSSKTESSSTNNDDHVRTDPLRASPEPAEVLNQSSSSTLTFQNFDEDEIIVPNFRMGFLLGKGRIQLKQGGYPTAPVPFSNLEFRELRLGIETRPGAGLLLEALLGTFEVVDLQKRMKIMYPRVPWAGDFARTNSDPKSSNHSSSDPLLSMSSVTNICIQRGVETQTTYDASNPSGSDSSLCAVLHSYPYEISDAIFAIRGEYGLGLNVQMSDPMRYSHNSQYRSGFPNETISERSQNIESGREHPQKNIEETFQMHQTPLKYIAALRLNQEEVFEGDWAQGSTRMAMDLAIGGMEVLLDGPQGAFLSSVMFWHPREKMPSIMQFLAKSAAPRLASLRMDIQKAILERTVPMRMDILIRGPRFVMPAPKGTTVSLVLDLGTFAMETSTGPSENIVVEDSPDNSLDEDATPSKPISVRYTDYRMACTDLGLYIMPKAGIKGSERVITPFSVHLLLQVMHNSSFVDAVTVSLGPLNVAKVKLQGELPSLKISVSHDGFRNILRVAKGWGSDSKTELPASGIEPNRAAHSLSIPSELEEIRHSQTVASHAVRENRSRLISFSMNLDFEDLQLELRDSMSRRIVTISSSGTQIKLVKRSEVDDFEFRVHTFTVIDGSRGATAPFRRIAYAGIDDVDRGAMNAIEDGQEDILSSNESQAFISLSYRGDVVKHEQSLAVRILSLNLVCVRETYFALADFFYLSESQSSGHPVKELPIEHNQMTSDLRASNESLSSGQGEENESVTEDIDGNSYSDPFAALGMTTSEAARAFRDQAGRGMEISKQAFANRGQLSVNAELDGLVITLVTAEGAIACFDVSDCKTDLTQYANGTVIASGELGGFGIRDLTSAFDVYSETIRYDRSCASSLQNPKPISDGWSLRVPESSNEDIWLEARLRNIRIVYLHRFIVILKKYFDVLRESLKPVLEMKGGIAEMFDDEVGEDFPVTPSSDGRIRIRILTEDVDLVMPRHSQSPYEALRFFVAQSSITNDDPSAPGYQIGFEIKAEGVNAHVLYQPPAEGEGRALTKGGTEPVLKQISPNCPIADLLPFSENIWIVAKLDTWRRRRVPEVILNTEGIPVLKDGQEEREYDPGKWLPSIRVRVSAPNGISARLCEAEYSILYFTFTENIIERPDIEFTDIVRGLKTPILPTRKPVQPIMFSSNRMPPNYQILFEVPLIESVIMSGADGRDDSSRLIRTELRDLLGSFEYGVDYRMTIDVSANMHSLQDARPYSSSNGMTLIMPTNGTQPTHLVSPSAGNSGENDSISNTARSITLTWDRPFGFRANVMVVASHIRIIVEPELFRDLGALTAPGFPFLKSSAPPPLLRFNGRLLIVTISKPEIWLMANQYPGDGRSLVIRGDLIAKVLWAPVTGRNTVEVAAHGVKINLSSLGPQMNPLLEGSSSSPTLGSPSITEKMETETPMLYSCDVSMKFEGRGYDPPQNPGEEPRKAPGSSLSVNAESFLVRIDVNDASLILAVGSRLVRLKPSKLSQRPEQPGRFDQWIDKGDEGDAKLSIHFSLPHCRLMFTDETLGRYVPIMEARLRNGILRSNVPWLTNAALEFALDLFNEEKGWWEPGIESFPIEFASSKGRSGSMAIHVRTERNIDVNITPNTVSGAARVSKALKSAVEELRARLKLEDENLHFAKTYYSGPPVRSGQTTNPGSRRPSVAAFCVRNETGRSMQMWLPYDSKRRALRGNGGEIEVDTPSEEILWTALGATGGLSQDPSLNRQVSMSCILSLSGYEALTLSTEQTGIRLVKLIPDTRDIASTATSPRSLPSVLTLIWAVTMRDGVPYGCIRSAVRIVNRREGYWK